MYLGISLVAQASANGPHKTKKKKEKQCGVVPENARMKMQNVIRDAGMIWREILCWCGRSDGSRVAVVVEMKSGEMKLGWTEREGFAPDGHVS